MHPLPYGVHQPGEMKEVKKEQTNMYNSYIILLFKLLFSYETLVLKFKSLTMISVCKSGPILLE